MSLLAVSHLDVWHGNLQVLWDVSLKVDRGEIVTLIGPNGAGKSTLVETIFGLVKKARGTIEFDGKPILGEPPYGVVRRGLALVPERRELFPRMTVEENLLMGAYLQPGTAKDLGDVYRLFPVLQERSEQKAGTLSGGEQQMVAIGRALMSRPRMLVLDEPSLGLSPLMVETVLETVRTLNREGLTIFLVEQNVAHALEISHWGFVLENGRVVMQGSSAELRESPEVQAAYLGI